MLVSVLICSLINCHFLFTHSVVYAKITLFAEDTNSTNDSEEKINKNESKKSTQINTLAAIKHDSNNYEQICIDTIWNIFYEKYWVYIDASIYSFLPSILLTIFNISIIRYLFKAAEDSLKLKEFQRRNNLNIENRKTLNHLNNYGSLINTNSVRSNNFLMSNYVNENSFESLKRGSTVTTTTRYDSIKESLDLASLTKSKIVINKVYGNDDSSPYEPGSMAYKGKITTIRYAPVGNLHSCRRFNTRVTVMLIALNISFCIFSMPMVILQIIYYSFYPFLEATSYYMDSSNSLLNQISTTTSFAVFSPRSKSTIIDQTSTQFNLATKLIVSDIPVDQELLAKIDLIKAIAELLQYLNHSSNFFLYSFSGKTFRNESKSFIRYYINYCLLLFSRRKFQSYSRYKNKNRSLNLPKSYIRYSFKSTL